MFKKIVQRATLVTCGLLLWVSASVATTRDEPSATTHTHHVEKNNPNSGTEQPRIHSGETIFQLVAEAVYRNDPAWRVALQKSRQWKEQATVQGSLPNPLLTTGLFNVPLDSFSFTENPTTQWRLGLKQAIPRGKTLDLKSQRATQQSESLLWQAKSGFLQRTQKAQRLWLDIFFLIEQRAIVRENQRLLEELTQLAENKLAEGRGVQQDVIQARVETLRLEDELIRIRDKMHQLEAAYHAIAGHGDPKWPTLPENADDVTVTRDDIRVHPQIKQYDALLSAAETSVSLAREQTKPMWVVGGEYRKRFGEDPSGVDRNDLFAVTASIDLPFARKKARTAEVDAALAAKDAWQDGREKTWLQLSAEAYSAKSSLKLARESSALYRDRLLDEARLNVQAAEDAYAAGTGDFSAVISAQRNLLKTQLQAVKHQVNQWRAWVDLKALKGHWLSLFDTIQESTQNNSHPIPEKD